MALATWTTITDAVLEPDKPARSVDVLALRDNPIYLAENMIGVVVLTADNTAPPRTLECDGTAVSRTTYSDLFDLIGTTYGVGDGSTTFNLPDLRGEFIRGWDNGRGVDSGRGIGTAQGELLDAHVHTISGITSTDASGSNIVPQMFDDDSGTGQVTSNTGGANSTGGAETRPRNIALMPCIVYKGTG